MTLNEKTDGSALFARPAFILVRPQLAENVGTAARAMMNCALSEMRLVDPDEDPLCSRAIAASSGAEEILHRAKVFKTVAEAVADLQKVYATTGRPRDMIKPVFTGQGMAKDILEHEQKGTKCGVLFGPERTGLENDDMIYADAIVNIPLNPEHCSLNLAQAVLLTGYELFRLSDTTRDRVLSMPKTEPANKQETEHLFDHLEQELELAGYFKSPEKRPRMMRNLRNIFMRAELTSQDVRTLHGVITDLARR
ncbi:MAG: RNA methyltransferase [Alphaproteobacteria bacterium]|nr:RNA methyltransferase [Alphaproteobacteria bacterium]MBO4644741.1 RNA methyltransferase [Alphaproteobacteria bacterium]